MNMRRVAITLALVLMPSAASAGHDCAPLATALDRVRATHPYPIDQVVSLDPEEAARAVDWYNAQPPPTSLRFNSAAIVRTSDGTVALLLGNDGSVCATDVIAREDLPALIQAILGDRT
jgi:hypothetical protein